MPEIESDCTSSYSAVECRRTRRVEILADPAGEKVTVSLIIDTTINDPLTGVTLATSTVAKQVAIEYPGLPVQWLLAPPYAPYTNFFTL